VARSRPALVLAVVLAGCSVRPGGGDGGAAGSGPCELAVRTSGAIEWSPAGPPACSIPFGRDSGLWMWFHPPEGEVSAFVVEVPGLAPGEVGELTATVGLVPREIGEAWETPPTCTVIVDSSIFVSDDGFQVTYQIAGTGFCAEPAVLPGDLAPVAIEPFSFRFPARW
jgi:hypothetical protein